jgi:hypothetical protein
MRLLISKHDVVGLIESAAIRLDGHTVRPLRRDGWLPVALYASMQADGRSTARCRRRNPI